MAEKGKRCYNIAHKLQSREIGKRLALTNVHPQIKFRNFQLQEEFDTNQPSKIVEIVSARGTIFALAQSGVCAAFDRDTNKRLCYLNLSPDDLIRRLYYNEENDSLVTISAHPSDRFSLKYRTTLLEYIRRAQPDAGFALFEGEKLLRLDPLNGKVLVFSAQDHIYKVFDLKNYTLLYSISDKEIEEIKITSGIVLLKSKRSACGSILPLRILSLEDGKVLKSFHLALLPNKEIEFFELFHDKILLKQENECLQMVDVQSEKRTELSGREFEKPSTFIFLIMKRLFLIFSSGTVFVWNVQGELVASYKNKLIWFSALKINTTIVKLTYDQLLLSYNKVHKSIEDDKKSCSINISNILTGNCCATIGGSDPDVGISRPNLSVIQNTFQDTLEDITALFYDEDRNEIYTGNSRGLLHLWSN
ncbi:hypothetical protein SUGI_1172420 [Cryptomeria japonica]|uniref:uncharacterized protein LOC131068339 n=1 Tax=Cryptomeria japonica TaxID=3369 RepID=UPI0024149073|nr:uncharacterized protein LOC131068339 [Cryptomeria japonica]GLJ54580.1 hypothetical protein SUGI_1172420 [Cryptomeria japonica]